MPKREGMGNGQKNQLSANPKRKRKHAGLWALGLLVACVLLAASAASAIEIEGERVGHRFDRLGQPEVRFETTREGPSRSISSYFSVFDIELPMAFRARLAGLYTYTPFLVDAIAFNRAAELGPAVRSDHFFESRFSLVRPIQSGVELEVAWSSQSLVSMSANPSFDRQTVGAFIRFTR